MLAVMFAAGAASTLISMKLLFSEQTKPEDKVLMVCLLKNVSVVSAAVGV